MGLAIMTELPLVIVNSQRGGPSTGLPTKTEQSDLYQAVYGRNGDAPLPVIAARSPADAFDCAIEACRIAIQYMTPVMLLTDGYIANAAEPWKVPDMAGYDAFPGRLPRRAAGEGEAVNPYARDDKLPRVWIKPGTPGLMHRIGGIEKNVGTGHIDYAPRQPSGDDRHPRRQGAGRRRILSRPGRLPRRGGRQAGGGRLGLDLRPDPPGRPPRARATASTSATSISATSGRCRTISAICSRSYDRIIVPEMNTGQLKTLLRDQYLVDARPVTKVSGQPFKIAEIEAAIERRRSGERWTRAARLFPLLLMLIVVVAAIVYFMREELRTPMTEMAKLTAKDFATDQEVRWCPGCGDYAVLKAVQRTMPELGADPAKTVFVSGIGCSSRFPYYMETYGFHTIHGRAPAVATGVKLANPELDVWIITGDGDALSIGGNHTMHILRRNLDCQILLFNNEIYGLTKGQYSPTSRVGTRSPSTPVRLGRPARSGPAPSRWARARASSPAAIDVHKNLPDVLKAAHAHKGAAFVEIFQNCIVYNDDVFAPFTAKANAGKQLWLKAGEPMLFDNGTKGLTLDRAGAEPQGRRRRRRRLAGGRRDRPRSAATRRSRTC